MFYESRMFNQDIGTWDTSSVTAMATMFFAAFSFNQDISKWNTSAVQYMQHMFCSASAFDQPIGSWDTSAVTNMSHTFYMARAFNSDIGSWNTAAVKRMDGMFYEATIFDQDIGGWDTSAVLNMSYMFFGAQSFNRDIGTWDTSAVASFDHMFVGAMAFDRSISMWDFGSLKHDLEYSTFIATSGFSRCNYFAWQRVFPVRSEEMTQLASCPECKETHVGTGFGDACGLWLARPFSRYPLHDQSSLEETRCPSTSLACLDDTCAAVNSGFIEVGKCEMEECRSEEDLTVIPSSFGQCTSACMRNPNCTGFLFSDRHWIVQFSDEDNWRQGQRCDLRISQRPLPVRGSETQSTSTFFVFRRAGCDTFSCPSWGRPLPAPKLLDDTGAVTEAQCCTCSAPGAVQDL